MKKIVRLSGGLGNQIFQYSFAKYLETIYPKETVKLEAGSYHRNKERQFDLSNYNISLQRVNRISEIIFLVVERLYRGRGSKQVYVEKTPFSYVYPQCQWYYCGNWQNVLYIEPVKASLLEDLIYRGPFSEVQNGLRQKILSSNSVAVHVRRGDYLRAPYNSIYCVQDMEYYNKAISLVNESVTDAMLYIFSDDIEWCKEKFSTYNNTVFVENGNTSTIDFELMRLCKHHIISNSTYSWWAAYLEKSEGIKISPHSWFVETKKNEKVLDALCRGFIVI